MSLAVLQTGRAGRDNESFAGDKPALHAVRASLTNSILNSGEYRFWVSRSFVCIKCPPAK